MITVSSEDEARRASIRSQGRRWIRRDELVRRLGATQADAGLRDDLATLAGELTAELGPLD